MKIDKKFRLDNKIAIITGASKGIGKAIARAFCEQGARVIVSSRKQEAVEKVADEFRLEGMQATGIAAHMGNPEQIKNLAEQTLKMYGGIDIVVNNAAINPVYGPIIEAESSVFDKIMQVNVKGPLELSKLVYPSMKARGDGSVINISSIEGITPGLGLGLYSISKSALISLTKVLAREWGKDGIRVNVICPGLVKTKFSEALTSNEQVMKYVFAKQALQELAKPEDIAGMALYLASQASSFVTGGVYPADGGYII